MAAVNNKQTNIERIMTLSVVIPVYNPQKYLINCLDSVLNQSFNNFELIIVNDASTDDSIQIINQYSKKDDRIKVFNNLEHQGAAYSRNIGLKAASGKYIIFLDADDFFELDFFENMISAIESAKADIAICGFFWRDERYGTDLALPLNLDLLKKIFISHFSPSDFNCKIFYDLPFAPFNKLIRRDILLENNIYFQNIANCNDVYFGVMSTAVSKRVVFVPKTFIHYRYNTGSQISTNRYKNPLCICYAFQKIREDFLARGIWNKYCQMYLKNANHFLIICSCMIKIAFRSAQKTNYLLQFILFIDMDFSKC